MAIEFMIEKQSTIAGYGLRGERCGILEGMDEPDLPGLFFLCFFSDSGVWRLDLLFC